MPPYVRPTKQIGLRLSQDLYAQLAAAAQAEDRSIPYIIKRLLTEGLRREENRKGKPKKTKTKTKTKT